MSLPSDPSRVTDVKQSMIYCGLCLEFCPSTSFGALKPNGKNICDKHPPPKLDTKGRYCRKCDEILCVTEFPLGQRRFICKRHSWNDKGKVAKEKLLKANPWKKELARLYSLSYSDCKFFGQSRIGLTQTEIAKLFMGLITPPLGARERQDKTDSEFNRIQAFSFAVLPLHPEEVLSKRNAALVRRADRIKLLCYMKKRDWETYNVMIMRLAVAFTWHFGDLPPINDVYIYIYIRPDPLSSLQHG